MFAPEVAPEVELNPLEGPLTVAVLLAETFVEELDPNPWLLDPVEVVLIEPEVLEPTYPPFEVTVELEIAPAATVPLVTIVDPMELELEPNGVFVVVLLP